ncbi:MAG: HTTM domain-containing protein, partial [Acidobacteriaceae bacterium]
MRLARFQEAWERFFFAPQSPTPMAVFRILYGVCVMATLVLLHGEWLDWYGVHSWVTLSTMQRIEPGVRLNLFTIMPQNDHWVTAFFWVFLGFAVLLTVGLWTRLSSVIVFICLASMQQRNLYILHGGDVFLRVAGFFLMFAPAGAALSVDRAIRVHRKLEGSE